MNLSIKIFCALLRRDIKIMYTKLFDSLINGTVFISFQVLIFGYLFPLMGMSPDLIAPIFLGSLLTTMFTHGYTVSLNFVYDLHYDRFIDYHLTLPLPKRWLFLTYVLSTMLELVCTTIPIILFGTVLLGNRFVITHTHWPALLYCYIITLLLFSLFFLSMSFVCSFVWFRENIWARVLSPLLAFGCTLFPWSSVMSISPCAAWCMRLNPLTYVNEGWRAALLGDPMYLPLSICLPIMTVLVLCLIFLLRYGIYKQLDPL